MGGEHLLVVIGSRYAIFTTDSNDVRYMLSENFDNYQRSPVTRANFTEFLGDGIFTSMGETWRTLRKTAQPHFKVKNTKFNSQAMVKHAKALIDILMGFQKEQWWICKIISVVSPWMLLVKLVSELISIPYIKIRCPSRKLLREFKVE